MKNTGPFLFRARGKAFFSSPKDFFFPEDQDNL